MLNEIISSAKEGVPTDTKQGSMLRYQIALDATGAISRISECIRNTPQSHPEDIVSMFQASPLIAHANPKPLLPPPSHRKPIEQCALFLYHHAQLALAHRTYMAAKAVAPTTSSTGVLSSSKSIQPRNALRLTSSFSHSTIEKYQKLRDLPLLIRVRPSRGSSGTVTLSGSSDPISLILSHGMRRVRSPAPHNDAVTTVPAVTYPRKEFISVERFSLVGRASVLRCGSVWRSRTFRRFPRTWRSRRRGCGH